MTAGTVTLVAFGTIALLALAAALVIRDLVFGARVAGGTVAATPGRLRRMPNVFDQAPLQGFFGRVDQGFDRLVLESGAELTSYAAFLLLLVGGLLLGGGAWLYTAEPLNGVAGGLAGMALPLVGLAIRRSRRLAAVREQLPHVLDMLARGTRAGQSVEQAIQLVAEEAGGVLGAEFRRCRQQLEMGRAFDRTLKSLAARVRLVEMRILTTTLIVQRQTGGHLSETLERMAGVIRDRLNAQRQIRAATGAGRTSTLVVAGIAPLAYLCVFAFHREHIDVLYQDAAGRLLLLTALVLELIGLLWVFALLRREE
jgi:tight adherence protein B